MIVVVVNMFIFLYEICQLRSWTYHKTICTSIATLHGQHKEKTCKSGSYSTNLTSKEKKKVAEVPSDKCVIQCRLNQREALVLLDTGAQVSIISEDYVQQNHSDSEIKHISHILDEPDSMSVQWGNNADIPLNSFTVMQLNIGDEGVSYHVDVPFFNHNRPYPPSNCGVQCH